MTEPEEVVDDSGERESGTETEDGTDDERSRPSRRTLVLILVPIAIVYVTAIIGNAIHPSLLNKHPLWLVAMEPRTRYLLLVAAKEVDFIPFLVIATLRRLLSDPLYYLLGVLYGKAGIKWIENRLGEGGAIIGPIQRGFSKAAPVFVFLIPGPLVCALAGSTGMNVIVFFALNIIGTISAVFVMYHFAGVVEGPLDAINGFYGRYGKWLTIVSIVITVLWFANQRRQGKGEFQSLDEIERELEGESN